jgi:restriction system protein
VPVVLGLFFGVFAVIPGFIANKITHNLDTAVKVGLVGLLLGFILFAILGIQGQREYKANLIRAAEGAARLAREQHLAYLKSDIGQVDQMRGIEFEQYVAARLRENGWEVSTTAATGDYGVDLIAKRGDECIAVQCKRYGKSVGVSAVQQVVAGAMHHHCWKSMVVSNQEFTKAAKLLAETHNCRLVGRTLLRDGIP